MLVSAYSVLTCVMQLCMDLVLQNIRNMWVIQLYRLMAIRRMSAVCTPHLKFSTIYTLTPSACACNACIQIGDCRLKAHHWELQI